MSAYTDKRNGEKHKSLQRQAAEQEAVRASIAANRAFRQDANQELHVEVRLDERTCAYWRLSQILRNPKRFCQEAGLPFGKQGLADEQVQRYITRHQRPMTAA